MKTMPPIRQDGIDELQTITDMAEFLLYTWTGITIVIIMFLVGASIIAIVAINDSTQKQMANKTAWIIAQIIGFPLMGVIYTIKKREEVNSKITVPQEQKQLSEEREEWKIKTPEKEEKRFMPGNGL